MLQEGHAEHERGRDVVVGLVETHGRVDTASLLTGFEVLLRRRVVYRGIPLDEMDLPAILRRAPEVCLIDELAHTNAPGVERTKRYEDIEDVLDAGINVVSTLNVQHLDSLNDRIAELTGITVRETVPDLVLTSADEVVIIDVSPETLLDRLRRARSTRPRRSTRPSTTSFASRRSPRSARSRYASSPSRWRPSGSTSTSSGPATSCSCMTLRRP